MPMLVPSKPVYVKSKEEYQMALRGSFSAPKSEWPLPAEVNIKPCVPSAPASVPMCGGAEFTEPSTVSSSPSASASSTMFPVRRFPSASALTGTNGPLPMVKTADSFGMVGNRMPPAWKPLAQPMTKGAKRGRKPGSKTVNKVDMAAGTKRQRGIESFLIRK